MQLLKQLVPVVAVSLVPALLYAAVNDLSRVITDREATLIAWTALALGAVLAWRAIDEYLVERDATVEAMKPPAIPEQPIPVVPDYGRLHLRHRVGRDLAWLEEEGEIAPCEGKVLAKKPTWTWRPILEPGHSCEFSRNKRAIP